MHDALYASPPAGARAIPIYQRGGYIKAYALVDEDDYEKVNALRWYMSQSGHARHTKYVEVQKPRGIFMHRLVLGLDFGDPRRVDHINRDVLDNRKSNLRLATVGENKQNCSLIPGTSSRYRGVSRRGWKYREWQAKGTIERRQYHLGFFDDEDEAGAVAAAFRKAYLPFAVD